MPGTPHSGLQTVLRNVFKLFEQKSPGGGGLRLSLNDLCPGSLPQGEGIILKRSAGRKNSVCTESVHITESFHVTEKIQNVETLTPIFRPGVTTRMTTPVPATQKANRAPETGGARCTKGRPRSVVLQC